MENKENNSYYANKEEQTKIIFRPILQLKESILSKENQEKDNNIDDD